MSGIRSGPTTPPPPPITLAPSPVDVTLSAPPVASPASRVVCYPVTLTDADATTGPGPWVFASCPVPAFAIGDQLRWTVAAQWANDTGGNRSVQLWCGYGSALVRHSAGAVWSGGNVGRMPMFEIVMVRGDSTIWIANPSSYGLCRADVLLNLDAAWATPLSGGGSFTSPQTATLAIELSTGFVSPLWLHPIAVNVTHFKP